MSDGEYIINDEQYFGEKDNTWKGTEIVYNAVFPSLGNTARGFIHPTAIVYPNVYIGENVYIGAYSVIGGPPEHREYWDKEYKGVIIGNNVRISNHVTIDAGCTQSTHISKDSIFLAHSHCGHDVYIGENVTISCGVKIGGYSIIEHNSNIGLNACIHQYSRIPEGVMIGMGGIVTKKSVLLPNRKYVGNPVRDIGENIKK